QPPGVGLHVSQEAGDRRGGLAHEGILPPRVRPAPSACPRAAAGRLCDVDPLSALEALPGVADALRQERDAVDKLLANRWLRRNSADVSVGAGQIAAAASATLDDRPLAVVLGLQAASAELARTWEAAPRQALARMHVLACADLDLDPEQLG